MNQTLVTIGMGLALVLIVTPSAVLISAYTQAKSIEAGNINWYTAATVFPKVVVIAFSIATMHYAAAIAEFGWVKYLLLAGTPPLISVMEIGLFTGDLDDWHELRELYLSHDGDGDWVDDIGDAS